LDKFAVERAELGPALLVLQVFKATQQAWPGGDEFAPRCHKALCICVIPGKAETLTVLNVFCRKIFKDFFAGLFPTGSPESRWKITAS
jgi:hypothetical protein